MFNYQIIIEYLGSNYVGWQYQKNGVSIQSLIEKALSKILRSKVKINGFTAKKKFSINFNF